jgi:hypothetical protein
MALHGKAQQHVNIESLFDPTYKASYANGTGATNLHGVTLERPDLGVGSGEKTLLHQLNHAVWPRPLDTWPSPPLSANAPTSPHLVHLIDDKLSPTAPRLNNIRSYHSDAVASCSIACNVFRGIVNTPYCASLRNGPASHL